MQRANGTLYVHHTDKAVTSAIALPILWVPSLLEAHHLSRTFQLMEHKQVKEEIATGEHYILAKRDTPESTIKAIAWRIQSAGVQECKVYSVTTPFELEHLAPDWTTAKELIVQILENALPYEAWEANFDQHPLTLREAAKIASRAIALLPESQKSIELGMLRERCHQNSFDWNKLVGNLELEFKLELERRQVTKKSDELDVRLRRDLQALINETDPIKKLRKRSEICSFYRLKASDVEQASKLLSSLSNQEDFKLWSVEEVYALESSGLQWIIPELLPKGETIILAGSPKAGKSLMAIDAAFAIATGESEFLGQTVQRGKVLLVSSDESLNSTRTKLLKRGFQSRDQDIRVLQNWTINHLDVLVAKLEEFRPDVVIIDSLRRITHGSQISENSAEFADNIYTLKETIGKYGASGILIHHTNKNSEAQGVGKIRGSSAIAGAVWGTWQLEHIPQPDPFNKKKLIIDPQDPRRVLSVFPRDTEGQSFSIEFNPENNSWSRLDQDIQIEQLSLRQRIIGVLTENSDQQGLSGKEIISLLGMTPESGRGVYTELNRMTNKQLISHKPASGDKRVNIYSLLTTQQPIAEQGEDSPPPSIDPIVEYSDENHIQQGFENTQLEPQELLDNDSTAREENMAVEDLDADTASSEEILNNFSSKGGECISPSSELKYTCQSENSMTQQSTEVDTHSG